MCRGCISSIDGISIFWTSRAKERHRPFRQNCSISSSRLKLWRVKWSSSRKLMSSWRISWNLDPALIAKQSTRICLSKRSSKYNHSSQIYSICKMSYKKQGWRVLPSDLLIGLPAMKALSTGLLLTSWTLWRKSLSINLRLSFDSCSDRWRASW